MGKGSSSAPAPDPQIGKAALMQAETGAKWLKFAENAFEISQERQVELDNLTKEISEMQLGLAKDQADWSREDRERYNTQIKPIEDQYIKEAQEYDTQERQDEAAATARADVQHARSVNKAVTERNNSALGIAPGSGRHAGINAAEDLSYSLAEAGASNSARQLVRDKGLALKADAINIGKGLPAQAAAGAAGSVAAGGAALSGNHATNQQYLASSTIMNSGFGGAMQGYAGQASTLNQQYGLQLDAWKAEQANKAQGIAGIGKFIGGIAGMAFGSSEDIKENKVPIEDGAALEAVKNMPVEEWDYKQGHEDEGHHIGTYAEDFQEQTGHGDGKTIPVQDAIGITMKAIQDLDKKVDDKFDQLIGLGLSPSGPKIKSKRTKQKGEDL